MDRSKKYIAGLSAALLMLSCGVSCSEKAEKPVEEIPEVTEETTEAKRDIDINGQTIVWLADYDLNPSAGAERSVALSLFEEVYGAKVKFVPVDSSGKYDKLVSMVNSGEDVDMFPYEPEAFPSGMLNSLYEPLDPYFDIMETDGELWNGMTSVIDSFAYNGQHFVVPYALKDVQILTYSRQLVKDNGLDDPYELYKAGKWDWAAFTAMMDKFVASAPEGTTRNGIKGSFGQALRQSTGSTAVKYDGTKFENNLNDPMIEKAENLMKDLSARRIYVPGYDISYPSDNSTLFFAMGSWTLGASNAKNQDKDIMAVPFPNETADNNFYVTCGVDAKMLVRNSTKGEAVAAYLKCERIAQTQPQYRSEAKNKAMQGREFVSEEQYNALRNYMDTASVKPVFDFGYGMGGKMYGEGDYTFATRGVMNKLDSTLLDGDPAADSWAALRDHCSGIVDSEIALYNK
ncbi:MAG: ABC transporter substrate-binding protein [Ruminococcus sp.]|nr:ABC transporter substrate-binding protein [Ruminococcus sp.]